MSAEEEVRERDLSEIANLLRPNNWKDFGRSLGLDGVQLHDLEFQYRSETPKELRLQMLLLWQQQCPSGQLGWDTLRKAAQDNRIMPVVRHIEERQGMTFPSCS